MAKKRGGVAGFYDRNKGWLRYVAPAVVGAIPGLGPLAAAGLGAAMRGFDREGKSGTFFDLGQGVRGGIEGYGMGSLGAGAKAGVSKLLAPSAPSSGGALSAAGAPKVTSPIMQDAAARGPIGTVGGGPTMAPPAVGAKFAAGGAPMAGAPMAGAPMAGTAPAAPRVPNEPTTRFGKFTKALEDRSKTTELVMKGLQSALPSPETNVAQERVDVDRQTLALQRQQYEDEQRRRQQIAMLLMPMYQQMMQQRGGQMLPPTFG